MNKTFIYIYKFKKIIIQIEHMTYFLLDLQYHFIYTTSLVQANVAIIFYHNSKLILLTLSGQDRYQ